MHSVKHKNVAWYVDRHYPTMKSIYMCIDCDSPESLALLFERYRPQLVASVIHDWRELLHRGIYFSAKGALEVLLKESPEKITPAELELAVHYCDLRTFRCLLGWLARGTSTTEKTAAAPGSMKIPERVIKACIQCKKPDFVAAVLDFCSREFVSESQDGTINGDCFPQARNIPPETIYNIQMMKKKLPRPAPVDFASLHKLYASHTVLHLAIESGLAPELTERIISGTDISLKTARPDDQATPLILATKVSLF